MAIITKAADFYRQTIEIVAQNLTTSSESGLSSDDAAARLGQYGPNKLKEKEAHSPFILFVEQFKDFIIWVLIGAAVVSGFLHEWVDACAIVAIVILNAILGFVQEYRAEKSLAALKRLASPVSKVIRGGVRSAIASAELVPGDLIELEAGDNVPADCRVIWASAAFTVQEAMLTGESSPVTKTPGALDERELPLADRANMLYMGTIVNAGKARAIVTVTGMDTELGKIAHMIQELPEEATPLQKKLEEFGKWIVYLCFALVGCVFALGLIRGGKVIDIFLTSVSLAVAAIPEGLPAVVTIALALGVQRMVRRHALIRKLPSVETLGCTTVICSDKTGTLTKNEMTVRAVWAGGTLYDVTGAGYEITGTVLKGGAAVELDREVGLVAAIRCGILCNGADLRREGGAVHVVGDPTEIALLSCGGKLDLWKDGLEKEEPFVNEIPFDSERKKMTIIRRRDARFTAYVKGAPDLLLNDCTTYTENGAARTLNATDREMIMRTIDELSGRALRVIAVASRDMDSAPGVPDAATVESGLTFLGLIAMIDPPREEVKHAIARCAKAGIRTVMITGDHKNTAVAIGRELGLFTEGALAVTGEELDRMDEPAFSAAVERISVYARVSPEHKLRIVRAWRARGEIVAMTGDGVNDAPAVKEADIGVAMGITGTDVTKEVSDMVITDDNFASIVAAVEEGRGIYDNIKKFIHYLLSCNAGEILIMFISSLFGLPAPLVPIQILWVNLVTDGLPALALGVDPVDPDIMSRPPRKADESVVTRPRAIRMLAEGAFIALCSLTAFMLVLFVENEGIARARTAAFIVLSCAQLFHAFNCRSMTRSLFKLGIGTNKKLIAANLISFSLQMAVVYIPFLQTVFKTEPLGLLDWVIVISLSSFPLWAVEIMKMANRKRHAIISGGGLS